jgi:hypothetical protein
MVLLRLTGVELSAIFCEPTATSPGITDLVNDIYLASWSRRFGASSIKRFMFGCKSPLLGFMPPQFTAGMSGHLYISAPQMQHSNQSTSFIL